MTAFADEFQGVGGRYAIGPDGVRVRVLDEPAEVIEPKAKPKAVAAKPTEEPAGAS